MSLVQRAARALDQELPGWADYVDTKTLTLWTNSGCVLGQIARRMPAALQLQERFWMRHETRKHFWAFAHDRLSFSTLQPALSSRNCEFHWVNDAFMVGHHIHEWIKEIERRQSHKDQLDNLLMWRARPEPRLSTADLYALATPARELVSA